MADWLSTINGFAATATVAAAIMVASNYSPKFMLLGFVVYTVASAAWILSGIIDDKTSLVFQNSVLIAVSLFGMWRWWPGTAGGSSADTAKIRRRRSA